MCSLSILSGVFSPYIEWCVLSILLSPLGASGVKETPVNEKLAKDPLYGALEFHGLSGKVLLNVCW